MFQQDTAIQWGPGFVDSYPGPFFKVYGLALLMAIVVMLVRLIGLWIAAPPFKLSRRRSDEEFLNRLRATRDSMKQWMGCVLLGSVFVACTHLVQWCDVLIPLHLPGSSQLLHAIRDFAITVNAGFFTAVLLFLAQWHISRRIQRLRLLSVIQANH